MDGDMVGRWQSNEAGEGNSFLNFFVNSGGPRLVYSAEGFSSYGFGAVWPMFKSSLPAMSLVGDRSVVIFGCEWCVVSIDRCRQIDNHR